MIIGDNGQSDYASPWERPKNVTICNGCEYEIDDDGDIICPFCGESDGVDEDIMMCTNCKENI